MDIFTTIEEVRLWRKDLDSVAFVPTMGNLHEGHLNLIHAAKASAKHVIVSIFVNRLQFGQGEDFSNYPRTFQDDCDKLKNAGVDAVFYPEERVLYPRIRQEYNVEPPYIQNELCGQFRPGHFRGVATVVCKLFNIVQPDIACFGKKDYQQLQVIRGMCHDLNIPVKIIPVDTGRADDGLALSSRNSYLSAEEREEAPRLYRNLLTMREALIEGACDYKTLEEAARADLSLHGWEVDYIEVRCADNLAIAHAGERRLVVLAAARLGRTRLIDNLEVFL